MCSQFWLVFTLGACAPDQAVPGDALGAASAVISGTDHANDLRAEFAPEGVQVWGLAGDPEGVRMSLQAWGREGALTPQDWVSPEEVDDDGAKSLRRVEYVRDGLVEWWEENAVGFEHGFTLTSTPPGDGLLLFDVVVDGAVVVVEEGDGTSATFARPGTQSLHYSALQAWDGSGRTLPAWMEETDVGLRLVVDDSEAVGLVTVDPLLTAGWTAEANQENAAFGSSVASAGDVNGDGYGDVVVGAHLHGNGQTDEGTAYLYVGSARGLAKAAAWTVESDQDFGMLGSSVASAGDVNADGYDDVVVGALGLGEALLYLGSVSGLATTPAWTAESGQALSGFAISVASAGDVNGDGYGDVVVGAHQYDNGSTDEGRAFVYLGSASGLAATAAWTSESNQDNALFGFSVSSAGDVNGDGYGDVVVGAFLHDNGSTDEGGAFVYLGSASGLATTAAWSAGSDQDLAEFGNSVSSAGDVNADGYGDVVVGSYRYDNGSTDEGRAYVYLGSATGLATTAAWTVESDQDLAELGLSVSSAGDVNDDGYGDIAVGAWRYDNGSTDEGTATLYLGSDSGLATTAAWTGESDQAFAAYGRSVSSAGDVNGDGFGDLLVGAYLYNNGNLDEGRAFMYLGGCSDDGVDSDGDTVGDACDVCQGFDDLLDADLDGVPEDCDLCPFVADAGQEDTDSNGVGDACVPLTLTVHTVSITNGLSLEVGDALPGERVIVYLSVGPADVGPCMAKRAGLCLDLGPGKQATRSWPAMANANGHVTFATPLTAAVPVGTLVTVQAATTRGVGGVKSDPVQVAVAP